MNVLVLVAHADDETLGCGGTIARLVREKHEVRVVIVSDANAGVDRDNRKAAFAACKALGCGEPYLMDFPDQRFDTYALATIAHELEPLVAEVDERPDLVLTHAKGDLNADHRIVRDVACVVHRRYPVTILGCEVPGNSYWAGNAFAANVHVQLEGDDLTKKLKAFREYVNEVRPWPDPWSEPSLQELAMLRGSEIGVAYAEGFELIRAAV